MSEHWNVQIKIQRVTNERVDRGPLNAAANERNIVEVLSLAVVADDEREAYEKAMRLMKANAPWAMGAE